MSQILLLLCFVLLFGFDIVYSASLDINSDEDNINNNNIDLSFSNEVHGIKNDDLDPFWMKSFSVMFPGKS